MKNMIMDIIQSLYSNQDTRHDTHKYYPSQYTLQMLCHAANLCGKRVNMTLTF